MGFKKGFKRDKRQFLLKFADDQEDMAGFECLVGSLSIGKFIRFTKALAAAGAGGDGGAEANRLVMSTLVANIVEWNLEDDDGPVPVVVAVCPESGQDIGDEGRCAEHAEAEDAEDCQVTGLYAYDLDFAMSIATAWMEGMAGVAAPLGSDSPSGNPSLEGSLPMELP